jgi:hypothetical protein
MTSDYASNREFDIFLAGGPRDEVYLDGVAEWLSDACGFSLVPRAQDPGDLAKARNFIFAVSEPALESAEFVSLLQAAARESARHEGLRFVLLIRDEAAQNLAPASLADSVVAAPGELDVQTAFALLEALYPAVGARSAAEPALYDVYLTRSWLDDTVESAAARQVCQRATVAGFRLIGDTEDPDFDPVVRIPEIMAGCGGFIAVLPYRENPLKTSEWMLQEMRLARAAGLPALVVRDPRVELPPELTAGSDQIAVLNSSTDPGWTEQLDAALIALRQRWRDPENPADVLYLTNQPADVPMVRSLADRITGMALTTAETATGQTLMDIVRTADIVVCDASGARPVEWMILGCAAALNRKVELLADADWSGESAFPGIPVNWYSSKLEWLGRLCQALWRHRRRIVNPAMRGAAAVRRLE